MVVTFFIISGFVLTTNGLAQIRSKRLEALVKSTSSAAFRRLFRIWLPVLAFSLINAFATRYFGRGVDLNDHGIHVKSTLGEQLSDWWFQLNRLTNPFGYEVKPKSHLNDYARTSWTLRMYFPLRYVVMIDHRSTGSIWIVRMFFSTPCYGSHESLLFKIPDTRVSLFMGNLQPSLVDISVPLWYGICRL